MMNLICLMVLIQFLTFKITLNLSSQNKTLAENPPIEIYPNKIKNRTVFKIKTGYKLELLSLETMRLLGSEKQDVDKDKDGEDVAKRESAEVVLVHCNLVSGNYQQTSKVLFIFVPNKKLGLLILFLLIH